MSGLHKFAVEGSEPEDASGVSGDVDLLVEFDVAPGGLADAYLGLLDEPRSLLGPHVALAWRRPSRAPTSEAS